jgi:hypothetical protein
MKYCVLYLILICAFLSCENKQNDIESACDEEVEDIQMPSYEEIANKIKELQNSMYKIYDVVNGQTVKRTKELQSYISNTVLRIKSTKLKRRRWMWPAGIAGGAIAFLIMDCHIVGELSWKYLSNTPCFPSRNSWSGFWITGNVVALIDKIVYSGCKFNLDLAEHSEYNDFKLTEMGMNVSKGFDCIIGAILGYLCVSKFTKLEEEKAN